MFFSHELHSLFIGSLDTLLGNDKVDVLPSCLLSKISRPLILPYPPRTSSTRFHSTPIIHTLGVPLVPALLKPFQPLLNLSHVRECQLQIDDLDVRCGIYFATHVDNIIVLKTPNNMYNRIHFANVRQKFVSWTLSFTDIFDKPSKIHKLNRSRNNFRRFSKFGQILQTWVWHSDNPTFGSMVQKGKFAVEPCHSRPRR
ncbi:hypothetical protein Mapa_002105 [Marchantia paleacea]|nr:hypothetical protein Mapa_002105 [Marchantia paleacea]